MNENNFNKKSLAAFWKISVRTLNLFIKDLFDDENNRKQFGNYRGKKFTQKQIQLLSQQTGFKSPL